MSTQRRCDIFKATDGRWYMILGCFEYAEATDDCAIYGPFTSDEDAIGELHYHSNPGGWCTDASGTAPPPAGARRPSRLQGRIPMSFYPKPIRTSTPRPGRQR